MLIRYKNRVMGYLIMENMHEHQSFDEEICEQFRNIKEHLVSAFIKTNLLHEIELTLHSLENTQQELIRKEKLASVGKLTQGIVDRIINPLNYINNFAQLSAELIQEQNEIIKDSESNLSDENTEELTEITVMLEQNVKKIHEHGTNTARIVKGMENLLRDRSGEKVRTDMNSLLTQGAAIVQKTFSTYENGEKIIPVFQLNKELNAPIIASGIAQVIYHLLHNAFYTSILKSKKANIDRMEVEIKSSIEGNFAIFSVKDYGMGISDLEKKKIFDPFFTTKPTAEGTGTGLFIAKEIIQNHSGRIDVESSINEWTVFTVYIPITS
jgi:signal transduction histidine kinase